ncbi:GNAT family N-acetyltransferase [Kosmotoga pacifica]|uniref:GNAT family N-acetyltransferase n=1 Tax=Kosmotoga pacifica TaxID=1330330 RepID=UPI00069C616C|nr:GNAT family N-acetyltransferase [Kosmotoga pacifica]
MNFRKVSPDDYQQILRLTSNIWDGEDYIPDVFESWVRDKNSYFYCLENNGGKLVALGRLVLLDDTAGWLEGLRVDPAFQGKGYGKEMAKKIISLARNLSLKSLYFSTYFRNTRSIRINEDLGFSKIETFTNLQLDFLSQKFVVDYSVATFNPCGFVVNDWVFFPARKRIIRKFLPDCEFLDIAGCRIILSKNLKYPDIMEISWIEIPKLNHEIVKRIISLASKKGFKKIHLMLKAGAPLAPFLDNGFYYFERSEDVYLYEGKLERLRLI